MNTDITNINQYKGMFWGLVIGDCLGSPVQFSPKDDHPHITEMVPCDIFNTPPGFWTDDSSMAFCIAESYVRLGHYDLQDIANNFVRWIRDGFWSSLPHAFDIGQATMIGVGNIMKLGQLENGTEESQGNGSIIRLAPAYIINVGNPDNKILHQISDLTHCSTGVRNVVDKMTRILDAHVAGSRSAFRSCYSNREQVNNSGWAVSTLQAALWAFDNSDTFEDGMIAAVNLGGDADSIGAVFGQIAGAFYGFDAIPERWLKKIKNADKVNALIEDLIQTKFGKPVV